MRLNILMALSLATLVGCNLEAEDKNRPTLNRATEGVGTATETASTYRSQLHRLTKTTILSAGQEARSTDSLPIGYEDIPTVTEADDGIGMTTTVSHALRATTTCGTGSSFATLKARIDDCTLKNPNRSSWSGTNSGNAGEGDWVLVASDAIKRETWLDQTTGYLWSDVVVDNANWCNASGNKQTKIDTGVVDCSILGTASICAGSVVPGIAEAQVSWRLPTRADFLQADVNGARFVLPNSSTLSFWTATVSGEDRDQAWTILPSTGLLTAVSRADNRGVRCIGRRK